MRYLTSLVAWRRIKFMNKKKVMTAREIERMNASPRSVAMQEMEVTMAGAKKELGIVFFEDKMKELGLNNVQDILYRIEKNMLPVPQRAGKACYWSDDGKVLLTTSDVAKLKNMDTRTIQKMVTGGKLKPALIRKGQMFFLEGQDLTVLSNLVGRRPDIEQVEGEFLDTADLIVGTKRTFA